ncbi:hypothetical protein V5O48_009011 [Marasmius crinis-equi]|uniref:Uncharacterized protein n=1 Tax=Marasmius crinis-equi TaxID=585013 RepID=A0ABR3FCU6_9AGAR
MPVQSRIFGRVPVSSYPTTPPISLSDIDDLEKFLVRKELKSALESKIEDLAALKGICNRRQGFGHIWTSWRVSFGVTYWPDVGRLYRKCLSLGHWRQQGPCVTRPRFMTPRLSREQLVEIEEMRALYDALGTRKWSLTSNPGGSPEVERARWIRLMWREQEHATLETLGGVFLGLLDQPTDKEVNSSGWNTDPSSEASWINSEVDSDEEAVVFRNAEAEEDTDADELDKLLNEDEDVKEPNADLDADPLETAAVETATDD